MDKIIHFGLPKTGSSSIQQTLFHLQSEKTADFTYITIDGAFDLNRLIRLLYQSGHNGRNVAKIYGLSPDDLDNERNRARDSVAEQIRHAQGKAVIFSSEVIPYIQDADVADLREQFAQTGSPPKAVGYIRPPKGYIESIFQQRVKESWGHMSLHKLFPHYKRDLEKFDHVFGRENVSFRFFDPKNFVGNCVVQDFAGHIGITVPPQKVRRANDSLSLPAIQLLFAYRKFGVTYGVNPYTIGNRLLLKELRALQGPKLRFHSSLIAPLLEEYKDEILWMENRMGISLAEDLAADDASAVHSEEALLAFSPETLQWLSARIKDHPLAESVREGDPEVVAKGMHALYNRALGDRPNTLRSAVDSDRPQAEAGTAINNRLLRIRDFVPPAIHGTTIKGEELAAKLMSNLFERIKQHVSMNTGGQLVVESLGAFRPAFRKNNVDDGKGPLFVFRPESLDS